MLVLHSSGFKLLYEQENLMNRFLLMAGFLAQFLYDAVCPQTPLKVLRVIHRIPLFVLRFNETVLCDLFHRPKRYLAVMLMLFSLCTMTLLLFFLLLHACCFCRSWSGPVCGMSGLCYIDTCIHGHTWINTAQSRFGIHLSSVDKCLGCFTGEQHHAD